MTAFGLELLGNTITAFGRHEWLISAIIGETNTPIGVSEGVVSVTVLVVNYSDVTEARIGMS